MVIAESTFFCHACLEDKTEADMSPDSRYCQSCHEYLLKEAAMLPASKRPAWIPRTPRPIATTSFSAPQGVENSQNSCNEIITGGRHRVGRPCAGLSIEQIGSLRAEGYSLRGIADKLKVSHMAVKRALVRQDY